MSVSEELISNAVHSFPARPTHQISLLPNLLQLKRLGWREALPTLADLSCLCPGASSKKPHEALQFLCVCVCTKKETMWKRATPILSVDNLWKMPHESSWLVCSLKASGLGRPKLTIDILSNFMFLFGANRIGQTISCHHQTLSKTNELCWSMNKMTTDMVIWSDCREIWHDWPQFTKCCDVGEWVKRAQHICRLELLRGRYEVMMILHWTDYIGFAWSRWWAGMNCLLGQFWIGGILKG